MPLERPGRRALIPVDLRICSQHFSAGAVAAPAPACAASSSLRAISVSEMAPNDDVEAEPIGLKDSKRADRRHSKAAPKRQATFRLGGPPHALRRDGSRLYLTERRLVLMRRFLTLKRMATSRKRHELESPNELLLK